MQLQSQYSEAVAVMPVKEITQSNNLRTTLQTAGRKQSP